MYSCKWKSAHPGNIGDSGQRIQDVEPWKLGWEGVERWLRTSGFNVDEGKEFLKGEYGGFDADQIKDYYKFLARYYKAEEQPAGSAGEPTGSLFPFSGGKLPSALGPVP